MTINQKITKIRRDRGIRQRELAPLIGLTTSQFSRVMRGKRHLRAVELLKLCRVLEVDPSQFLFCDELTGVCPPPMAGQAGKEET